MTKKKKKFLCFITLLIPIAVYLLLFGNFFPFSPVIIGFECKHYEKVRLYFHNNEDISGFSMLDTLIAETEAFHHLQFKKPVKIFVFSDNSEMKRLTTLKTRMATYPGEGRIFISYNAKSEADSGIISLRIYVKHELSHSLIAQNTSLIRYLKLPDWLVEGIAMVNAQHIGHAWYPSRQETFEYIKKGIFIYPEDYGKPFLWTKQYVRDMPVPNKTAFFYSEFGCIVEDIIHVYGKDEFITFLHTLLRTNDTYGVFKETFGISFDEYIEAFKQRANSK